MNLTTDEAQTLLDVLAKLELPERQRGDIDARQYKERMSISINAARARLAKLSDDGVLIDVGMVYDSGKHRQLRVWRLSSAHENDNSNETC